MFGQNPEAVECGDGKIIGIFVTPIWGRRYFVGPAKVPWTCPFNQLELLTVGGRPAIAQLDPACPGGLRLAVIERVPNNNEPGILVVIDSSSRSSEETAALAAQIMGVRP